LPKPAFFGAILKSAGPLYPVRRGIGKALMNYKERIVRDAKICGGEPVFKGTRVTLRTILASLAGGDSPETILAAFPSLKPEDVQAAISFAAASAEEDLPVPEVPHIQ
jgi:uncharacterized protein (DUF433 family)